MLLSRRHVSRGKNKKLKLLAEQRSGGSRAASGKGAIVALLALKGNFR